MRKAALLVATAAAALAAAGTASAGCMATVGLSPLPAGSEAGEPWVVDLVVRQHGLTPLADASPSVVVEDEATGRQLAFAATLVDAAEGRYRASVVFPTAGSWSVAAYDGFPVAECARTHTFGSYEIGTPGPQSPAGGGGATPSVVSAGGPAGAVGNGGSSFPLWPVVAGIAGALALLAGALAAGRLRARRLAERRPVAGVGPGV
jgi:hypothetical protein